MFTSLMRMYNTAAKLGHVNEPELIAREVRNVRLTAARSNSFTALSNAMR
jgi:hypothetical protein